MLFSCDTIFLFFALFCCSPTLWYPCSTELQGPLRRPEEVSTAAELHCVLFFFLSYLVQNDLLRWDCLPDGHSITDLFILYVVINTFYMLALCYVIGVLLKLLPGLVVVHTHSQLALWDGVCGNKCYSIYFLISFVHNTPLYSDLPPKALTPLLNVRRRFNIITPVRWTFCCSRKLITPSPNAPPYFTNNAQSFFWQMRLTKLEG